MDHSTVTNVHRPYAYSYADAAARTGATGFVSADLGKFARQLDDDSIWMLTATTPTWVRIDGKHAVEAIACSDETTAIVAATGVAKFRMQYAMKLTAVRASLSTAAASGTFTVDINESGSSILSTKLTIDATEKTSRTAAAAAVISDSSLADDAEISIDVDDDASGDAKGLKVYLVGYRV
jgi:hypothetical protein